MLYLDTGDMLNHKFLFAMETSDLFGVLLWFHCSFKSNLGVGNRSISIDVVKLNLHSLWGQQMRIKVNIN